MTQECRARLPSLKIMDSFVGVVGKPIRLHKIKKWPLKWEDGELELWAKLWNECITKFQNLIENDFMKQMKIFMLFKDWLKINNYCPLSKFLNSLQNLNKSEFIIRLLGSCNGDENL